jgi:ABC-type transporter Mla subunit MlaD
MTNRKNNIVVGLFVILSLLILLFGVYYLKEATPGKKSDTYYARFPQVSTLQDGDPVKINGVKMGKVAAIELNDNAVRVTLKLDKGVKLPKDSEVRIQNIGLMGERQVGILLGKSSEAWPPGSELHGLLDAGIAEAMGIAGEVAVESEVLVHSLRTIVDSTVGKPEFVATFNNAVSQTEELSVRLNAFIREIDPKVKHSLSNLEDASNRVHIGQIARGGGEGRSRGRRDEPPFGQGQFQQQHPGILVERFHLLYRAPRDPEQRGFALQADPEKGPGRQRKPVLRGGSVSASPSEVLA